MPRAVSATWAAAPCCESRVRSNWCVAPRLSGPTRTRSIRSGSRAFSTADDWSPSPSRRVQTSSMLASGSRRSANPSALAEDASSHWRSSIAMTSPLRRAAEARCEQQHQEPADRPEARLHPRGGARPRAPDAEAPSMRARRLQAPRRTSRPGRRGRVRARTRPAARRARATPARARFRRRRSRASISRSRPRPRARSRPVPRRRAGRARRSEN